MTTPMDRGRKVPLGKPLDLSDEDLDELAEITPADIVEAQSRWREDAPAEFKNLLDAEPTDEGEAR
jgi:hypothetical protein